jgi:hypothetical protein
LYACWLWTRRVDSRTIGSPKLWGNSRERRWGWDVRYARDSLGNRGWCLVADGGDSEPQITALIPTTFEKNPVVSIVWRGLLEPRTIEDLLFGLAKLGQGTLDIDWWSEQPHKPQSWPLTAISEAFSGISDKISTAREDAILSVRATARGSREMVYAWGTVVPAAWPMPDDSEGAPAAARLIVASSQETLPADKAAIIIAELRDAASNRTRRAAPAQSPWGVV